MSGRSYIQNSVLVTLLEVGTATRPELAKLIGCRASNLCNAATALQAGGYIKPADPALEPERKTKLAVFGLTPLGIEKALLVQPHEVERNADTSSKTPARTYEELGMCKCGDASTVAALREELDQVKAKLRAASEQAFGMAITHNQVLDWCAAIAAHHEEGNHDEVKKCLDNVVANKNRMQAMQH
jgi:hypothetical protein